MSSERVATNVLRWETDQAALNASIAAARKIEAAQEDVARANEAVGQSARQTAGDLSIADRIFDRMASDADSAARALEQVEEQARDTGKAVSSIPDIKTGKGGKTTTTRASFDVGQVDTAVSALGTLTSSIGIAGAEAFGVAGDIFGLIDAMGPLKAALLANSSAAAAVAGAEGAAALSAKALLISIGPFAAVAGVGAVAFAALQSSIQETSNALQGALAASEKYYDLISTGTTEDVEAAIKAEERRLESLKKQQEEAQYILDESGRQIGEQAGVFTGLLQNMFAYDVIGRRDELNKQIAESEATLERYKGALGSAEVATNDAAAATEELAGNLVSLEDSIKQQIAGAIENAQRSADTEIERARIIKTASEESINAAIEEEQLRIAAIESELEALRKLPQDSKEVQEAIEQTSDELSAATDNLNFLQGAATEAAQANDQLARAEQRLTEVSRETDQALRQVEQSDEKIMQLRERMVDLEVKANEQRADVNEKLADDLTKIDEAIASDKRDHAAKMADIEADFNKAMQDLARDAAGAAADYANEITNIENDRLQAIADAQRDLATFGQEQQHEDLKAERQTLTDIARVRADWRREQLRAEQDLSFDLNEAVLARDIDSIIRLQREFATESQRRAEDAQQEIQDIEARRQERVEDAQFERRLRQQEFLETVTQIQREAEQERAEAQRQFSERVADIQYQAEVERQQRAQAIAEEQQAFAERQAMRQQEIDETNQAAQERLDKIKIQLDKEQDALQGQIEAELEIRAEAIEAIIDLESERVNIAAGNINNIVLAEERLAEQRRKAVDELLRATTSFQNQSFQNLQNVAINLGGIATNIVANVQGNLQAVVNQAMSQVSSGLNSAMQQVRSQVGVTGMRVR